MASKADLSGWWFDLHQRGIFTHCRGTFAWCVADNIAHATYVKRLALRRRSGFRWICPTVPRAHSWVYRKHDRATLRGSMRLEHADRARRVLELGWGR